MEIIQINSQWHEKHAVIKGDYGEALVLNTFENEGFVIYTPAKNVERGDNGRSHGFDMMAYKNGKFSFAIEVKTKAKCIEYPETGFEEYLHTRYVNLSKQLGLPLLVVFVDADEKAIYGNWLTELDKPLYIDKPKGGRYPKVVPHSTGTHFTRYYYIGSMKIIRQLTDAEVAKIKSFPVFCKARQLSLFNDELPKEKLTFDFATKTIVRHD